MGCSADGRTNITAQYVLTASRVRIAIEASKKFRREKGRKKRLLLLLLHVAVATVLTMSSAASSLCSCSTKAEGGLHVGIIGAGIAGVCAAIALRRAGHTCEVSD